MSSKFRSVPDDQLWFLISDSPETSNVNTTAIATSSPEPDPNELETNIHNIHRDSLPPMMPGNATNEAQDQLPVFNSPPLAFTSPHATSLPNGSQHPRPTSTEISLNEGMRRDKNAAGGPGESETVPQLCRRLSTDAYTDKYTRTQPCLSSDSVGQYLVDPFAVDSVNSVDSANLSSKQIKNNAGGGQQEDQNCSSQLLSEPSQIQVPEDSGENVEAIPHYKPVENLTMRYPELTGAVLDTDLDGTSRKRELVTFHKSKTTLIPPRCNGYSPLSGSKPSGSGLHYPSIVNDVPRAAGATANVKLEAEAYIGGLHRMKSASLLSFNPLENMKSLPVLPYAVGTDSVRSKPSIAASSSSSKPPQTTESLNMLNPMEHQETPIDKRKLSSDLVDSREYSQSSPKKKRKTTLSQNAAKHCNCKKTKCLKLYCQCFSAGKYCAEFCACQECLNKADYEDTVIKTRQVIESRNPIAFASKIERHNNQFINTEGGTRATSSGRHKIGCNCKKSMCLKKYCECFQANVPCSTGCRCDGCKNVYDRNEEYDATKHGVDKEIVSDRADEVTFNPESCHSHNPDDSTNHDRMVGPPFQLVSSRYLQELAILASNVDSTHMLLQTNNEELNVGSYNWPLDDNNPGMAHQFPPRWDALLNQRHLTPPSDSPLMSMTPSTSSRTRDLTNTSQNHPTPGTGYVSSGVSPQWRISLITPTTELNGILGTESLQSFIPDYHRLYHTLEDDTPAMLKDSTQSTKNVEVSSPHLNHRVSPPESHMYELGSSSSGPLRSARQISLHSVPPFPPRGPCIDSKGNTDNSASKFENGNSSK